MAEHMTDSMQCEIGDEVEVNEFGNIKAGTVDNRKKTFTAYQYLVSYDNGGRSWVDAQYVN